MHPAGRHHRYRLQWRRPRADLCSQAHWPEYLCEGARALSLHDLGGVFLPSCSISVVAGIRGDRRPLFAPNVDRDRDGLHGDCDCLFAARQTLRRAFQPRRHAYLLAAWKSERLGRVFLYRRAIFFGGVAGVTIVADFSRACFPIPPSNSLPLCLGRTAPESHSQPSL